MWKWYLYALFVFGLACLFLYVAVKNFKFRKGPDIKLYKEREDKLFRLYQNIEDLMDSFEEYVENTRKELSGGSVPVSREQSGVYYVKGPSVMETPVKEAPVKEQAAREPAAGAHIPQEAPPPAANKSAGAKDERSDKFEKVTRLLEHGMSFDDIAQELDIGKGEVKLIYQLNKQKKL